MNFCTRNILGIFITIVLLHFAQAVSACGFEVLQSSGCQGFVLNAQDTTAGSGSTASWTVTSSTGQVIATVIHNNQLAVPMNVPGNFTVTMTDTVNGVACTASLSNIVVYPNPVVAGHLNTSVTCVGNCVMWMDNSNPGGANCSPLSYLMDWGNGAPLDPIVIGTCNYYPTNGTYSPSLIIRNSCGCRADTSLTHALLVTAPPSATFTGNHLTSCVSPLVSTMTAPSNGVPNSKYYWYIATPSGSGNYTLMQANGSNTFTYGYPQGSWDIKLVTVDTLSGCTDSSTRINYVNAGSHPAACFTADDTAGCTNRTVTFTPCSLTGTSYTWYFNDASGATGTLNPTSAGPTPGPVSQAVSYYYGGCYDATLVVTYSGGCADTLTKHCYPQLGAYYSLSFTSPDTATCTIPACIPVTYTGQACSTCTFIWSPPNNTPNAPDGHSGTCYNITSYGQISPSLTVQDTVGHCTSSIIRTNYINVEPITAHTTIQYVHGRGCANDSVIVQNTSTGGPFSAVSWSFPGATIISQSSTQAEVSYSSIGCHPYSMIIQNAGGCIDTLRDSVCIGAKPAVTLTAGPTDICFESICNTFQVTGVTSTDTPTSIIVWPEGIAGGAPTFSISPAGFDSTCYMYQDFGNFSYCYLPKNIGCPGDTTCINPITSPSSVINIFPPVVKFNQLVTCRPTDSVTFVNQSLDATSFYWTFQGVTYPNISTFSIPLPQCGVRYSISLTATNDTSGCTLTKSDSSVSVPCYGADFRFGATRGCYYAYDSPAYMIFTPGAYRPTLVLWSAQCDPGGPVFSPGGYTGDTVPRYNLGQACNYNVCAQLTYPNGCIDTICKPDYINITQPKASFSVPDTNGCVPFCVPFTNTSTVVAGAIRKVYWNFGDGSPVDSTSTNPIHCFQSVGQFQVCITIVDTNGCIDGYCLLMQANIIHAAIGGGDAITCPTNSSPLNPVTYTDSSSGYVYHHQWLLPAALAPSNPNPGDVPSITEQYANLGCDSIGMVAIDQYFACRDTVWQRFCVVNPVANYYLANPGDTLFDCPPAVINEFIDSSLNGICSYAWTFGDGNPAVTTQNPGHIWIYPGTYPVKEVVTSCHGCVDSITRYNVTIHGPSVSMTANTNGGCPCLPVTYTVTSVGADTLVVNSSNGGSPSFIRTPVPRGSAASPTVTTFSFTYCNTGDIRPIVRAIQRVDSINECAVPYDSLLVPIPVDSSIINFSTRVSPCGVDSVCFTNLTHYTASYAHDSIITWDFGDGSAISHLSNPCHLYPAPGDYTVTITVMNNVRCVTTLHRNVHVPGPIHAVYSVDDSLGCAPFLIHFRDSSVIDDSTHIAVAYWNFGDNSFAYTGADTAHTYTTPGTYTPTLFVQDANGCKDSVSHIVTILGPPTVTVGPDQTICLGDTATLSGSGSSTLAWQTDYNINDTTLAAPRVWPRVDTTYVLRVGVFVGCYVYDSVHVYISTIAIAQDTAVNYCLGAATAFTASASAIHSTVSNYGWAFGDGAIGSGAGTTHVYSAYGTYSDTLIVTSALGCKDTAVRSLTIFDKPHASFTLDIDTVCPGAPINATNTSTAGTSAALSTFTFNVPPVGTFNASPSTFSYTTAPANNTVSLYQTDLNGCSDTAKQSVYVYVLPQTFNIDTTICPGDTITLRAIGSNTVAWTPNYNIDNTATVTPRVWPATNTTYIAQVGAQATCYVYDTVNVIISTITVSSDTAPPACLGQASNFTASAQAVNATISSYSWSFGDNTTGTGQTTSHLYGSYGTFNDVLVVTSSRGCKDTVARQAIVYDIPHAALSISADSVCLGGSVTVNNLSTAGASAALSTSFFDMQPDGTPDITANTGTYTYTTAGSYTITLVQLDNNQCADTAKHTFIVHALPQANFNSDTSCINTNNQYISSTVIGDGPITSYSWTVNGTNLGIDSNIVYYTFPTSGTENICLHVQDGFGCVGDTCKSQVILTTPAVTVTPQDTTICAGFSDTVNVTGNIDHVQWVPSTWVSDPTGTNVVITPKQTIRYQLYIYYRQCVPRIDTVTVWVIDSVPVSATADPQNIILGLSSNVTSSVKGTIDSIVWDPDSTLNCRTCNNPIATPHQTTTYNATVYYSRNGVVCSNRTSVTVTVYQSCDKSLIYVPNTFTPNGDGRNEVFRLRGQGITKVNYFRVYDRWGKLVYEALNADDADSAAWNGGLHNDTGKPENTGVFVYEFEITCVTGQTVTGKGNVTLLR